MQSTNVRQIKTALVEQAFLGSTCVSCTWGKVVAVSRWKGPLRVMILGWRHWHPVESVRIERTGPQLLQVGLTWKEHGQLPWWQVGLALGASVVFPGL